MSSEKTKLPSAFSLFDKSWKAVQRNLNVFAVVYALPLVGTLVSTFNAMNNNTSSTNPAEFSANIGGWSPLSIIGLLGGAFVVLVIVGIIGSIIQTLMTVLELESANNKVITFAHVWERSRPLILRMLGLQITMAAIFVVSFLLLIIPFFFAIRRYLLAPYYLVDKNLSIGEALKQSAADSKGYAGAIWGVIGVMILLSLTGIVPVIGGLISFSLGVAYSVAPALRYFEIKKHA